MLTYRKGNILDPKSWVKSPEPVFRKTDEVCGVGGPAVTTSPDGKEYWLIYHANQYPGSGWLHRCICAQKIS
ncbi:MAG: hypothetical protein GX493_03905 [Firmicutes bacterium]|nr:hypothetical protein [Bacillota bacterium]